MNFEHQVKHLLVTTGFRHRNRVLQIVERGNGIDTMSRRAWFAYEVMWVRKPSNDLRCELSSNPVIPPTSQAYASDVDWIELRITVTDHSQ